VDKFSIENHVIQGASWLWSYLLFFFSYCKEKFYFTYDYKDYDRFKKKDYKDYDHHQKKMMLDCDHLEDYFLDYDLPEHCLTKDTIIKNIRDISKWTFTAALLIHN
jgi:hypothetical protein